MSQVESKKEAPRILIVDDVEANRLILKDIILEMEYMPILTENGVQALKFMERCRPQLIILDVAMPKMDGFEFCKIVKGNPGTRDIPIIFISAFDEPEDVVKGFNLGGEDYITKPFIREVVKARVSLHLKLYENSVDMIRLNRQLHASINEQIKMLQEEKKKVLYVFTRIAREISCYDEKHMERLSYNSKLVAEAMQLSVEFGQYISDTFIETIALAAPLCDIGNMSIPLEILQKTNPLTEEELAIMKTHTVRGAQILKDVQSFDDNNEFMKMSIEICECHHENWDGSGYPNGCSKNEIPLSAQIVSIVATYCALTENRVYRESFTKEEAFAEMDRFASSKYNPKIYSILKKISRQLQ